MITPFDLFGKGKYCYTFRSCCEEEKEIFLADGAVRIFLNTRGKNDDEVSQELIDFLHYIEHTDEKVVEQTESEKIKKIHECVKKIKASEEMGVKYMQTWEEKIIEREKGKAEGIAQGKAEGIRILVETCMEFGISQANAVSKVADKFLIPIVEAESYVNKYWK